MGRVALCGSELLQQVELAQSQLKRLIISHIAIIMIFLI